MFYCFWSMQGWGLIFIELGLHLLTHMNDHKYFATRPVFSKKRRTLEQNLRNPHGSSLFLF